MILEFLAPVTQTLLLRPIEVYSWVCHLRGKWWIFLWIFLGLRDAKGKIFGRWLCHLGCPCTYTWGRLWNGVEKHRGLVGAKDPQLLSSLGPTNLKDNLSPPIFAYFLTSIPIFLPPLNYVPSVPQADAIHCLCTCCSLSLDYTFPDYFHSELLPAIQTWAWKSPPFLDLHPGPNHFPSFYPVFLKERFIIYNDLLKAFTYVLFTSSSWNTNYLRAEFVLSTAVSQGLSIE